jgi:hypothetical protein
VGSVTCGDAAITRAQNAIVAPVGVNIEAHANGAGRFTLNNVPND